MIEVVEGYQLGPRAALRELDIEGMDAIGLDPGLNVLLTGQVDAARARDVADACRSSRATWWDGQESGQPVDSTEVARIMRSELELRAARIERARAHQAAGGDHRPSEQRTKALRAQIAVLHEQADALVPELVEARARLGRESDIRDRIAVACDLVEFAMLDDAEAHASSDDDELEVLALEWDLFVAARATSVAQNREEIAAARRALDAATARRAMSGSIGTIDAATMDTIQRLHQQHQEAAQRLETSRRNQRQERVRELEEAAGAEKAALQAAGLDSYSDFLMLRVRAPQSDAAGDRGEADVARARAALDEATEHARAALAEHESEEIELRARAATLLGRLPGPDVATELRDTRDRAYAADEQETPTALVELAALCRQADLDTGTDPVATARAWLRAPSVHARTVARLEAEMAALDRQTEVAAAELEAFEQPAPATAADGVESVTGAIRNLLSRGALVPNTTRSVDIDPPIVAALREAIAGLDRDARGAGPLLVEYPWAGEPDAVVGRMLSVFRDAAAARQVIVVASAHYGRPVQNVRWIDLDVPVSETLG